MTLLALRRYLLAALLIALARADGLWAQVAVLSPGIEQRQARPGSAYSGTVTLANQTAVPQEARIYQTDYLFFADGSNRFDEPGTMHRSNARWVTFGPDHVTLAPGTRFSIDYTVTVPDSSARLEGTYWSLLMVEGVAPAASADTSVVTPGRATLGVRQVLRQAIQIVTHIAATGTVQLVFANPEVVTTADGRQVLRVDLTNTGSLGVIPEVWVELFSAEGASIGKRPGGRQILYPGTSIRQRIDLGAVPPGTYQALVVADAHDQVFGAQYRLRL